MSFLAKLNEIFTHLEGLPQPQRMKKVTVDTFGVDYPEPEKV